MKIFEKIFRGGIRKNICSRCKYQFKCMEFRYKNIELKFMQKISIKNNCDKSPIIYVQECSKFKPNKWKQEKFVKI